MAWMLRGLVLLWAISATAQDWIARYSGSFDPPTLAHKQIILEMAAMKEKYGVRKIEVFVNATSDVKSFKASTDDRIEMMKRMVADISGIEIEIKTITQEEKNFENPNEKRLVVIGEDSFFKLPMGIRDNPNRRWVVAPRPSQVSFHRLPVSNAEYLPDFSSSDISSTQVRRNLARGDSGLRHLDPQVVRYIHDRGLYGTFSCRAFQLLTP